MHLNQDILINGILCIIMIMLLIAYCIYVIIDERKKERYYKDVILYETNWDKYNTMVKKQKRIILKKELLLLWLTLLVGFKRLIRWK